MKKYVTSLWGSMDPSISARIIISYYGLTRKKRQKSFHRLYLRLGSTVVWIVPTQKEKLLPMLRNTLITLCLFRDYTELGICPRSAYIRRTSVSLFTKMKSRKYMTMALPDLLESASQTMAVLNHFFPLYRLNVPYTPKLSDFLLHLIGSVTYCTHLIDLRVKSMEKNQ